MKANELDLFDEARGDDDAAPRISLLQWLTWIGEGKRLVAAATLAGALAALAAALSITPERSCTVRMSCSALTRFSLVSLSWRS